MRTTVKIAAITISGALIATPILAQQSERPSRQCMREVVQLCGRDREQIRFCLAQKFGELSANCSAELQARMQQRRAEGTGSPAPATPQSQTSTIVYGTHERQQIDYYAPRTERFEAPPLILFVHGGAWAFGSHKRVHQKPAHFTEAGFAFASTGYRVLPDAPVEQQAKDLGTAIQALIGQAPQFGFDPQNIVLIGHSAGAHLAALVAADPQYAGEAMTAIRGVILLDGAGYDIAATMAERSLDLRGAYDRAFGDDPARQAALSPVTHVGGRDAPDWLILYVEERDQARRQSDLLASALTRADANASAVAIGSTDHGRLNRELGARAGEQQTSAVDAFLKSLFE